MPSTRNRVPSQTSAEINRRIRQDIACSVQYYAEHKGQIAQRLRELDEEWDIERAIEANAAALAFIGTVMGVTRNRGWLVLPALVSGFLFQHAVQGWCPPVPVLRRLGFRTAYEIEEERQALKALRGDFDKLPKTGSAALRAARA
jgi:hypothetical protein